VLVVGMVGGGLGGSLVGWLGGWFGCVLWHDSWCKVRSVGMRNMWEHSMQHLVQLMVVSWSCGRERKAGVCSHCTWTSYVSATNRSPLLWNRHVVS
jgi:hypothetical protein